MKPAITLLLALSLTANVALLGVVFNRSLPSWRQPRASGTATTLRVATPGTSQVVDPVGMKKIRPEDEPANVAKRLRAAGIPERIVTAVITAQIRDRYAARRAALQPDYSQYWTQSGMTTSAQARVAQRELWREERQELKNALGDAYYSTPGFEGAIKRQFGEIPKNKIDALQSITEDYQDLSSDIYHSANGVMLPEDREKLAFLEAEKRKDLAGILTPQEMENYELRSSKTANSLRSQLRAFDPSEKEFRSLFALQREYDQKYSNRRPDEDAAARQQRTADSAALQAQIKTTLGEARYAEYQRAKDGNFQQLASLTARLELPKETAVAVYDLSKDMQKRAQQINNDSKLTPEQRNQALSALAGEANGKIVAALGERGLEAYRSSGGWWLRNLAPRPVIR
ncbi:MAG: hypothetical protein WC661_06135 [Opitutaceae bacterium]|jgi:hypothetical protein